jgi:hypothetical protein
MKCLTKPLPVFCVAALLSGCVSTRSIQYETITRPPKPADFPMEILDTANINRPYKVIGLVQANAGKLHNTADVIEQLKNEARKLGGDALIDLQQQPIGAGVPTSQGGVIYSGHVRDLWTAKVIIWQNP